MWTPRVVGFSCALGLRFSDPLGSAAPPPEPSASLCRTITIDRRSIATCSTSPGVLPAHNSARPTMKVSTVLLAVLFSACALVDARNTERCVAHCRTKVGEASETHCGPKRSVLPRPALYNHCNEGYNAAAEDACSELCAPHPNSRRLDSRRLDACSKLRGYPPAERMAACNEGFMMARSLASEIVEQHRRLTEKDADEEPAPKLPVKEQSKPSKNILEAAREEAAAAFKEAKSADL